MSEQKLLWQRKKSFLNRKEVFHLPHGDNKCGDGWHYFPTLCRKEIVGHNWEIKENLDTNECCKECLKILNSGGVKQW